MRWRDLAQHRSLGYTAVDFVAAARVKVAAAGRVGRISHLARKGDFNRADFLALIRKLCPAAV